MAFDDSRARRTQCAGVAPIPAASRFTTRLRERSLSAGGVMFALFFFAGLLPEVIDPDCNTMVPRLLYLAIGGPLITIALSLHYDWALRWRFGARWSLATSIALSALLGMGLAAFACATVAKLGLNLRLREGHEALTIPRAVAFGAVTGVIQFVIWALSFVYPFAVEDARPRSLEAETHKLEAERLRLESEHLRATAELASLRSQLEPHFLLNTLNAIAGLVTRRPKEARRLLACLGDILRDSLDDPDEMQPLGHELAWLERYAEILESRHTGALLFRWEIQDEARTALVPRLLLQPLVENAVKHGALQRPSGGEVTIRVRLEEGDAGRTGVVCEIEDNGLGIRAEETRPGAFGVRSVQRRLALEYEDATLRFESSSSGTRAIVHLPRFVSQVVAVEAAAQ